MTDRVDYKITIAPRISEVNGAQHIGASVIPVWLEDAAIDCFQLAVGGVVPCAELAPNMRKSEIDFVAEVFYPDIVEVSTQVEHVGRSSIVLQQQIVQRGKIVVHAKSVWVNTDSGSAAAIPQAIAVRLDPSRELSS